MSERLCCSARRPDVPPYRVCRLPADVPSSIPRPRAPRPVRAAPRGRPGPRGRRRLPLRGV